MDKKPIDSVLREHSPRLMRIPGVVGVGQGSSKGVACIRVFVGERPATLRPPVPDEIEGYAVKVVRGGEFRKRA